MLGDREKMEKQFAEEMAMGLEISEYVAPAETETDEAGRLKKAAGDEYGLASVLEDLAEAEGGIVVRGCAHLGEVLQNLV